MTLEKDGRTISLANENHVEAFLQAGWAEVKTSVTAAAKADAETEKKPAKRGRKGGN